MHENDTHPVVTATAKMLEAYDRMVRSFEAIPSEHREQVLEAIRSLEEFAHEDREELLIALLSRKWAVAKKVAPTAQKSSHGQRPKAPRAPVATTAIDPINGEWLNAADAAKSIGIARSSIYPLIRSKKLASKKIEGQVMVARDVVEAYASSKHAQA